MAYLFLARSENDFDHFYPIIHKLLSKENTVYLLDRSYLKKLNHDYRFVALCQINAGCLHYKSLSEFRGHFSLVGFGVKSLRSLYMYINNPNRSVVNILPGQLSNAFSKVLLSIIAKLNKKSESIIPISKVLAYYAPRSIESMIIDTNSDSITMKLSSEFRKRAIKTVMLQHSIPHISQNIFGDAQNIFTKDSDLGAMNYADFVIVPNECVRERYINSDIHVDKIKILGSPRFQKEWVEHLHRNPNTIKGTQIKTILILASKIQPFMYKNEYFRIIRYINSLPGVKLVVKPHTRNYNLDYPKDIMNSGMLDTEASTVELIDKADLILFWSTSVIYDPMILLKPMLYLKYIYTLPLDFEPYIPSWEIENRKTLIDRLKSFVDGNDEYVKWYDEYCQQALICHQAMCKSNGIEQHYDFIRGINAKYQNI